MPRIFDPRTPAFRRLFACVVGLTAMAVAWPAAAYVRSRAKVSSPPYFWAEPRQPLAVARPPDGIGISGGDLRVAAKAAINAWSYPNIPCTSVLLRLEDGLTDSQVTARDHVNRIIMRVGAWCRDPDNCIDEMAGPNVVALTSTWTRNLSGKPNDGQFLEADIEVNAVSYSWGLLPDGLITGPDAQRYDLISVLTHETGHFIGLDHTCSLDSTERVDDTGAIRPDCSNATPEILDATMYPEMDPGDVKLRTLTPDDTRAACEIYPALMDDWGGGGGCSVASSTASPSGDAPWTAAVMSALALAFARLLTASRPRRRRDAFVARH